MGKGFLIDTNVIIDFSVMRLPSKGTELLLEVIRGGSAISVITEIEVLGFSDIPEAIIELVEGATIFQLDQRVVKQTIAIRKKQKIKLPDAIIAATAIVHGLTLITRNTKDFLKIKGLKVVNPHQV